METLEAQVTQRGGLALNDTLYILAYVVGISAVYAFSLVVYRVYFHPLSHIPGPWLAGASYWPEFYYDCLGEGYLKMYPELHAQYGPLVRVTPSRVHIGDPDYYHDIPGARKYLKDSKFYSARGSIQFSLPMLVDPETHRIRKKTIQSLFSPKDMEGLSYRVEGIVKKGLEKLRLSYENKIPVDMNRIFRGITTDTLMRLMFDKTFGLIDSVEEEPDFVKTMRTFQDSFSWVKQFPVLNLVSVVLPQSWVNTIFPGFVQFRAVSFVIGTDTTSYALSMGAYHLISNPSKLEKLRRELETVPTNADGVLEHKDIRNLPYLSATVKEILRIACPVPGILPRVVPEEGMKVAGYYLPKGTIVSLAAQIVHFNESIYPDAHNFIPERWLGEKGKELENWFVTFSKGQRMCIGINMAYLETYLCVANVFSKFDFELYETNEETAMWIDMVAAARPRQNIKAMVTSCR
ncbi:hypothetical protein O1611_g549 [Lasiodiplodia mahajangana]|uniref:Uncharacterized protein n=1 Tax=Lasiodiplodia mahajangana TaxID=1108764 RepID=A0ACC2K036_9PEZI|nr:hypothetical protein O1611_g549 [Lasiodiplodia mahajangana]